MELLREPYSKDEVRAVVERRGGRGVPLAFHKWWGEGTFEKYGGQLDQITADIPDDVPTVTYTTPGEFVSHTNDPNYRWAFSGSPQYVSASLDARILLPDLRDLDAYLSEFPDPLSQPGIFDSARQYVQANPDRYILGHWWYLYYERLWAIRGMQNVLMDFLDHPAELKRLGRALLDYHVKAIRSLAACGVDGIFTSDDLGSQRALMMSPKIFRQILKPLYAELIAEIHSLGMHFWLHTCGNVLSIIDDFIDIGLDVIHPIQAHTMEYNEVAERFGGKISFLIGIDVQRLLPEGSPEEIRQGIHDVVRTFQRSDGGLMLAAGNGIMPETSLENIRTFLVESTRL